MKLLCAVDLDDRPRTLVRQAVSWAAVLDGEVHLRTSSLLPANPAFGLDPGAFLTAWSAKREIERRDLELLLTEVPETRRGTAVLMEGAPHLAVCQAAAEFELTLLGTAGREGLVRLFLGSVAERVVRFAPGPVLVVPEGAPFPDHPLRVVLPLDAEGDLSALHWVRSHLEVGQILPLHVGAADPAATRAHLKPILEEADCGDGVLSMVPTSGGATGEVITAFAAAHDAHLVAMPTHGRRGLARMALGSVAERVVRTSPCAVLVVRGHAR